MRRDLFKLAVIAVLLLVPGSMAVAWGVWEWAFDHAIGWALRDALNGIGDSVKPKSTPSPPR